MTCSRVLPAALVAGLLHLVPAVLGAQGPSPLPPDLEARIDALEAKLADKTV